MSSTPPGRVIAMEARRGGVPQIVCVCGEPLARVSRFGVPSGVYPVDGVRMEYEDGRITLFCPRDDCEGRVRLTVLRNAA